MQSSIITGMPIDSIHHPDIVHAAQSLLGCHIVRELHSGQLLRGRIVETEAYHETDPASHCHNGRRTPRNATMFGPAGRAYIYFTYGMHYCLNVVTGSVEEGAAVLIRALEPLEGTESIRLHRKQTDITNLCSGPAKLTQALRIDTSLNGHMLDQPPLQLQRDDVLSAWSIVTTTRIGISKATETPWRFYIKDNRFISRA